jgi:hypothetical protein
MGYANDDMGEIFEAVIAKVKDQAKHLVDESLKAKVVDRFKRWCKVSRLQA